MAKEPTNYPSDAADKYVLRFPDGMRDRLKAAAAASNRTLNAEIIARLNESLLETESDASRKPDASMLYEMRKTQLHLEMNSIASTLTQLFLEGQQAIQREKDGEISPIEREKALSDISYRKKNLDLQMSNALGRLHELTRLYEEQHRVSGEG